MQFFDIRRAAGGVERFIGAEDAAARGPRCDPR